MGQTALRSTQAVSNAAPQCAPASAALSSKITLGAGCYWGTEKYVRKDFQQKFPNSVKSAIVGFMNPDPSGIQNPSYEAVCTGRTGHVEVLEVQLHNPQAHFEELLRFFYMFHDPSTANRQGNDMGTQYASYIFVYDEEQMKIAEKVKREVNTLIQKQIITTYVGDSVKTKLGNATTFYPAEQYHQDYLAKNPGGYCNHYMRFKEFPATE